MNFRSFIKTLGKYALSAVLASSLCLVNDSFKKKDYERPIYRGLEDRLEKEETVPNYRPDKFALIVIASPDITHRINGWRSYTTLLENNWDPENIYILNKSKKELFYPVDGIANSKNLIELLTFFSEKLDSNDLFILYMTGHGGWIKKKNNARTFHLTFGKYLTDPVFNESEFEYFMRDIKYNKTITVLDFCYCGNIAQKIAKKNNIVISAALPFGKTHSAINRSHSHFLWGGLSPHDKEEKDYDKDGRINLKEAFDYAQRKNYSPKHFQIPVYYSDEDLRKIFID